MENSLNLTKLSSINKISLHTKQSRWFWNMNVVYLSKQTLILIAQTSQTNANMSLQMSVFMIADKYLKYMAATAATLAFREDLGKRTWANLTQSSTQATCCVHACKLVPIPLKLFLCPSSIRAEMSHENLKLYTVKLWWVNIKISLTPSLTRAKYLYP